MDYYKEVRTFARLHSAWRQIRENAAKSSSERTQREMREFEPTVHKSLKRIASELQREKFAFQPAEGIRQRRAGKSPRPIVRSPIINRIVQRSILDVLQDIPSLIPYFENPTSFGGIRGDDRGVAGAIRAAQGAFSAGQTFYVRSDITQFFTRIPRLHVVELIRKVIGQSLFCELLEQALTTELANLAQLGEDAEMFPIHEIGVAQGCCLSPLVGNVLLHDFDKSMNGRGVTTIRYIDDFLILAESPSKAKFAFESASRMLEAFNLEAYDPRTNTAKAQMGRLAQGLAFLGCHLSPGHVAPGRDSIDRIKAKIKTIVDRGLFALDDPDHARRSRASLAETLRSIDKTLHGWGNQYGFCSDRRAFHSLDQWTDEQLSRYFARYKISRQRLTTEDNHASARRLLGVHWLQDSKQNRLRSVAIGHASAT